MTSYTVTAAVTNNTFGGGILQVQTLNNAAIAGTPAVASSSTAFNANITTTTAGSLVFGALANETASTAFTAEPLCTIINQASINAGGSQGAAFKTTSVTGTPGSTLVGSSTAFPGTYGMAAMEILASGGTLAVDAANSPAFISSLTTTTPFGPTASFTPAAAATVLVAMFAITGNFSATTCVATITSSPALTWTEQKSVVVAESGTAAYAGVWTAVLPTGGSSNPVVPSSWFQKVAVVPFTADVIM